MSFEVTTPNHPGRQRLGAGNRKWNVKFGIALVLSTSVTPTCATSLIGGDVEISSHPSVVVSCSFVKVGALATLSLVLALCKADASYGIVSHAGVFNSIGRLYSVGVLLAGGIIKLYVGFSTLPAFACEVSSPCTVLSVGMWIARMCFERWSHQHLKEDRRFR
jgi:hypothetical protein